MEALRDHPVIENMERTGWPDGEDPMPFDCPCCGAGLSRSDVVYRSGDGEILGCHNCICLAYAEDVFEEGIW